MDESLAKIRLMDYIIDNKTYDSEGQLKEYDLKLIFSTRIKASDMINWFDVIAEELESYKV